MEGCELGRAMEELEDRGGGKDRLGKQGWGGDDGCVFRGLLFFWSSCFMLCALLLRRFEVFSCPPLKFVCSRCFWRVVFLRVFNVFFLLTRHIKY